MGHVIAENAKRHAAVELSGGLTFFRSGARGLRVPASLPPELAKHEARERRANERPRVACCEELGGLTLRYYGQPVSHVVCELPPAGDCVVVARSFDCDASKVMHRSADGGTYGPEGTVERFISRYASALAFCRPSSLVTHACPVCDCDAT